jgi:hypothetical protein
VGNTYFVHNVVALTFEGPRLQPFHTCKLPTALATNSQA